eukprot:TRINITY_DN54802_c0_g1_i1.p1 TRINITY_DN54802_c0_g1~~TRINITY_DN54802_c0_g1_i1.p1  ORF type:complete len:866 (+),score=127.43 TRINITY_DN54802_c0_g1_i1:64-2598(+)
MALVPASQGLKNLVLEVFITVTILCIGWLLKDWKRRYQSSSRSKRRSIRLPQVVNNEKSSVGRAGQLGKEADKTAFERKAPYCWSKATDSLEEDGEDSVLQDAGKAIQEKGTSTTVARNVLITLVRKGRMTELPHQLNIVCEREAKRHGADTRACEEHVRQHLLRVLRTCASVQQYAAALHAYDHIKDRIGAGCPSTWSLLLYMTVEAGAYDRGEEFYQRLFAGGEGKPTGMDVVNMVRCLVYTKDEIGLRNLLSSAHIAGVDLDSTVRNRCMTACCSEGAFLMAEMIVESKAFATPMDAIGYNCLIKSFARRGRLKRCFELQKSMRENGVEPSDMTFGILLDACINARKFDMALEICEDYNSRGHSLNTVHLTTIIKGLASSGQLSTAETLLRGMKKSMNVDPDIVTYQILVKAYTDRGQVSEALNLFDVMQEDNIKPDSLMCEALIVGCCLKGLGASSSRILDALARAKVRPSQSSLCVILWTFAQRKAWKDALDLLHELPSKFGGLSPGAALYAQLGLACINAADMVMAREVHAEMAAVAQRFDDNVENYASCRLLQQCISCDVAEAKAIAFGAPTMAPLRSTTDVPPPSTMPDSSALGHHVSRESVFPRLSQFISVNYLNLECTQLLSSLSLPQAEWVMDQGFLVVGAHERTVLPTGEDSVASAKVIQRVHETTSQTARNWETYPDPADLRKRLEDFISINNLDQRCSDTLQTLTRSQLLWVMEQEFLVQVDRSRGTAAAKVISFITRAWAEAKRQTDRRLLGPASSTGTVAVARALDDFVSINQLDDCCRRTLKTLPFAQVAWIMDQEFVISVDPSKGNASAKVVGLIKKLRLCSSLPK